jgi:hypothetical protein
MTIHQIKRKSGSQTRLSMSPRYIIHEYASREQRSELTCCIINVTKSILASDPHQVGKDPNLHATLSKGPNDVSREWLCIKLWEIQLTSYIVHIRERNISLHPGVELESQTYSLCFQYHQKTYKPMVIHWILQKFRLTCYVVSATKGCMSLVTHGWLEMCTYFLYYWSHPTMYQPAPNELRGICLDIHSILLMASKDVSASD